MSSACSPSRTSDRPVSGLPAGLPPRWPSPYLTFYLDRYIPSYRAELDHFITAVGGGRSPNRALPTDARLWLSPTPQARAFAQGRAVRVGA